MKTLTQEKASAHMQNLDPKTVRGFGQEWTRYDQSDLTDQERNDLFQSYFAIFPWSSLPEHSEGLDIGCGTGRWAGIVAKRVGRLHCVDPSPEALSAAKRNLSDSDNCSFYLGAADNLPVADSSMDFGYALGVLHHVPNTRAAISACVQKLKPGAPFLLYLYYSFDNRPLWFRMLWKVSDAVRMLVSRLPFQFKHIISTIIATIVYYPAARLSLVLERLGANVAAVPLSYYRRRSFYTMRTDSLDRFGTRLEKRFSRQQIEAMMLAGGLEKIRFSDDPPHWCAVGLRAK